MDGGKDENSTILDIVDPFDLPYNADDRISKDRSWKNVFKIMMQRECRVVPIARLRRDSIEGEEDGADFGNRYVSRGRCLSTQILP